MWCDKCLSHASDILKTYYFRLKSGAAGESDFVFHEDRAYHRNIMKIGKIKY